MSTATAPAKLILCGEHAVVYGRPAIALPLAGIRARAEVVAGRAGTGIVVVARDLRRRWRLRDDPNSPLSELIARVLAHLESAPDSSDSAPPPTRAPDLRITIRSTIPIASGMGSGAAVATALARAIAAHFGYSLPPAEVSALVYASERRFHGTPSGIDNTVVAYEQPILFQRRQAQGAGLAASEPPAPIIEPVQIAAPFTLLLADTGIRSPTRAPVGEVRRRWEAEPARYESLFDQVGAVVSRARTLLAQADIAALGPLLDRNHDLLQQIGVSSPELDALVGAARAAGALGAKLSGAGWGGVMLALVAPGTSAAVQAALEAAGAKRVLKTAIEPTQAGRIQQDPV
jgi:mevalonate kinase